MKPLTQSQTNPFKKTDSNKRYYTYDYYLRQRFGCKVAKITLDAGFTCPNIDGTRAYGGCIYCSSRGSGDFSQSADLSLREQYDIQRAKITEKWQTNKFIPYLQAHTNTYAPIERLRQVYGEVLALPDVVGVNIATRADCINDECLALLAEMSEKTELTVELGLQSVCDETARLINRAHSFSEFRDGYRRLREASSKIKICVHLINGLPGEDKQMMLDSARTVSAMKPDQIKLHLLHVISGTALANMYEKGLYTPLTLEEYADIVASQIEIIDDSIVIGRVTGDGDKESLLAPLWSLKKFTVMNEIDKLLYERNSWQGKYSP
ncbi:MAG: TIGR01212 family radical SAM protein [Clostridia bacterium]|nr:TIGR01212 family radical SAM protein [Clostridia bacterium]